MKRMAWLMAALTVALLALAASQAELPSTSVVGTEGELPGSLSKLYPPHSPSPVYLVEMHLMAQQLTGIMSDLSEQDMENVQKNYQGFKSQYQSVAGMVPEWSGLFPIAPVEELGNALSQGDQAKLMAAMEKIGQVCSDCHHQYLPQAQWAFHWGDFDAITVTDPLSQAEVDFKQLMLMMESNLAGVGLDLNQGQPDNARKQLEGFAARFNVMSTTCVACHDSERKYFVDAEITGLIGQMKSLLASEQVDGKAYSDVVRKLGQESCGKCHLVHIPAAYAKARAAGRD